MGSSYNYQDILLNAPIGFFTSTPAGKFLDVNPAMARMFGYESPRDMINSAENIATQLYVDSEDREEFTRLIEAQEEMFNREIRFRRKDGSIIWTFGNARSVKDSAGTTLFCQGCVIDITGQKQAGLVVDDKGEVRLGSEQLHDSTDRKKAEEALRQSEEKHRLLFESAPFGMCLLERDGRITYMNVKFTELFGYDMADVSDGRTWFRKAFPDEEYRRRAIALWKEDTKDAKPGERMPRIFTVSCRDGAKKVVNIISSVLSSGEYLVAYEDITERKKAEDRLGQRLVYERLLSRISTMAVEENDLARFLAESLKIMGETLGVSRVYLFEHHHQTDSMDNTVEWYAPEESPQKDTLQGVPSTAVPWWMATLKTGGTICFSDIEQIPDEGAKEILRPQGIRALLVVPLFVGGRYYGFMGFDECRFHRHWPAEDVEILLAISRIISEAIYKKQSQEEIERERAQLLSIFNSIEESIYISDTETYEILYVNQKLADTLQRDCVGGICYKEFQGLDEPCAFCTNELILKHKSDPHYWEYYNPKLKRHFFIVDRIIAWPDGRDVRFEMATDITERTRMEEALRESEERWKFALEGAGDGLWDWHCETGRVYYSPQWKAMLGFREEEIGDSLDEWRTRLHPDDKERCFENLQRHIKGETDIYVNEHRLLCKDGTYKWVLDRGKVVMRRADGTPLRVIGTHADLTDRKQAEEEKVELERRLARSQKLESIGTLAGGIAHDFNNLLTAIQGNVSLIMMDFDPSHHHYERLRHVEEHVASGADLTRQLLGFSRGGRYDVKPLSMNEIVKKSSALFGRTRKEISIHEKYATDPCIAEVDRAQMEQVLMNLFVNAWHAMPGGGDLFIETEKIALDEVRATAGGREAGWYVKVNVTDTGVGMDEKTRERVFDPFFTTKGMGRGSGLGLATVYGIIKGHKGIINVYSEPGRGTTFTLYIPASEEEQTEERKEAGGVVGGAEIILLVDDEKIVLDVSRDMLESLGYRVYAVGSGQEAVDIYRERNQEIALVILDMIMPGMSGSGAFDQLRGINPQAKVLLASGYSINGQAQEIIDRGCNGFIQKPFQLGQLSRSVREVLDK